MPALDSPITPDVCRAFVALKRAEGVLKDAAATLTESVPTLSKRLKPLVVGDPPLAGPWLKKEGNLFRLTEVGTLMLPAATDLADKWETVVADAKRVRSPGLTVACGQEAAGGVVLRAAEAFRDARPTTPLRVAVVRGRGRIEGVVGGRYDVALVTLAGPEIQAIAKQKMTVRQLGDDRLLLACGATAKWAADFADESAEVTAAQVGAWPFVLPETDAAVRQDWEARLTKARVHSPAAVIEVGGWRVLLGYIRAGFGVGLLPASVATDATGILTRPLADPIRPRNHLRVVTLPHPPHADLVAEFCRGLG